VVKGEYVMTKGKFSQVNKICEICEKEFQVIESRRDKAKFCSMKCRTKNPWNKGIKGKDSHMFGRIVSEEHKEKLRKSRLGKKLSKETKKKLSDINKEKYKQGLCKLSSPKKVKKGESKKIMKEGIRKRESHWRWYEYYGEFPKKGMVIHHINGNENDNSKDNLRLMTKRDHIAEHWRITYDK
jgi:hypothetical protein